ncbi:MAG TPA: serine/threonine-protein kinase, partial [Polyangiaceae bacterium]
MPAQNQSQVPVGTILEGKFRITKEIGRGGMAAVYEAENVDIGKRVAVKILAAELITSRVVRERFIREARAAAAIRSPYICDVYDSGMFEERPFLVMELLEGESLYDMMTRVRQIDVETTVRITTHTARGLAKAHESNVVHRDLKPENIFLTKDEDGKLVVKIVDFGLAKFYEPTTTDTETVRLTREGALFGTPAYMSPEQAKGKGEVDHRADLWALGCIVYECLTGQTVWNVEQGVAMILAQIASAPLPKPSKLRPDLPPSFDAWFARALDRDPDKRYQNAKDLAEALGRALTPNRAPARSMSLSSDDEGMVVDELIGSETFPASDPR